MNKEILKVILHGVPNLGFSTVLEPSRRHNGNGVVKKFRNEGVNRKKKIICLLLLPKKKEDPGKIRCGSHQSAQT